MFLLRFGIVNVLSCCHTLLMIAKDIISEAVLSVFLTPLNSMPYKFKKCLTVYVKRLWRDLERQKNTGKPIRMI